MKAMRQVGYGLPADVLELQSVEQPVPEDDEVLVRVHAAGVNWADWSAVAGMPYVMRLMYGLRTPRSGFLGTDVAGIVETAGRAVEQSQPGDEVFGWCTGAFAEYVSAPETSFVHKPADLTWEGAAGVPMAGFVALQALRDIGGLQPGQHVLIVGASGGIGTFAVQIAKSSGAEVTGVCSTPNVELVRSIGADHVIDYTKQDYTAGDVRYDLILDIADTHSLADRRRVLTPEGTLIPNSGEGGRWLGSIGRIIGARLMSPFVSQTLRPFLSLSKNEDLLVLTDLIESGEVSPVVGRTYPLVETAEAIAQVGERHVRGKTIITV